MSLSSILRRGPLRFGVLIAFIVLAAALARLADLATGWILAVIAIAWVLAALIERSAHRAAATAKSDRAGRPAPGAAASAGTPLAATRPAPAPAVPAPVTASPAPVVPTAAPVAAAVPPAARPRPDAPAEGDVWLEGDAVIDPASPPAVPWSPPPARRPERPAPAEPAPAPGLEPAAERVLPLPPPRLPSSSSLPQGSWNLWELEGIARDTAGTDRARDEERSLILMYLREFASAEGMLGPEFDDLVRESFGDLLPSR
jgi:hypothetical protein